MNNASYTGESSIDNHTTLGAALVFCFLLLIGSLCTLFLQIYFSVNFEKRNKSCAIFKVFMALLMHKYSGQIVKFNLLLWIMQPFRHPSVQQGVMQGFDHSWASTPNENVAYDKNKQLEIQLNDKDLLHY